MKFGSLFAGIGGIDLGLEWAGMECLWQVENDDYCNRVLAEHWPDVERFEDVRQVGKENLATVDLIAGGFPCQPHSVAGKRRGAEDDRNLWPEFSRIIDELQPRYVLAENVPGIITTYIDEVLSDLENKGYTCGTFNIPAVSLDAPHRRERIFIVAYSQRSGGNGIHERNPSGHLEADSGGSSADESFGFSPKDHGRRIQRKGSEGSTENVADSSIGGDGAEVVGDEVGGKETKRSPGRATRSGDGSGEILADPERASLGRGTSTGPGNRRGGKRTKAGSPSLQSGDRKAHAGELESSGEAMADSEGGQNQQRGPRGLGETPEGGESVNTSARDGGTDVADSEQSRLEGYAGDGAGGSEPRWQQEEPNGPTGAGGIREALAYPEGYLWRTSGDARPLAFDWRSPNQTETLYLAYTWGDRYIYCYWSEAFQNWQEIGVPIPHSKHTYWLPEPSLGRVANGVPSRVDRLRGLGNAVVPQAAEWVGLRIMEFDTSRKA